MSQPEATEVERVRLLRKAEELRDAIAADLRAKRVSPADAVAMIAVQGERAECRVVRRDEARKLYEKHPLISGHLAQPADEHSIAVVLLDLSKRPGPIVTTHLLLDSPQGTG